MRTFKKITIYFFVIVIILGISSYIYLYVLPKGPELTEVKPLEEGKDTFVMQAYENSDRKRIKVHSYKPSKWYNGDKIIFVMHGGGRNADDYLDAWVDIAEENNFLIVAPEFENKFSKYTTNDYQEGNLFTFFGTKNPKEEWAYSVVENIFDHIKSTNNISNETYDIFGHSAGGQFVHRMVMLMPESRIKTAVAANSGFYTIPDEQLEFPYGLNGLESIKASDLSDAYKKHLIVLLGELDNDPKLGIFRTTDLAMKQGGHRLERGSNFYRANKELQEEMKWEFNWDIDTVKNVGHNYRKMSESAIKWFK